MLVLSVDPAGIGGHSGVALGYYSDTEPYTLVAYEHVDNLVHGMVGWLKHNVKVTPRRVVFTPTGEQIDDVIVENFVDFGIRGADWSPLKVIGAVEGYLHPHVPILRTPGQRRSVSDEGMKALGAYVAGGHHRDVTESARHAVAWLIGQGHKPTIDKGWPNVEHF